MISTTTFQGFPKEGITFLNNLERNNNRDWFQENKPIYRTTLEEPAKAFLEEMSDELASLVGKPISGKIFRIYRDVRFSKDKTPYNTHVRISFMNQEHKTQDCGSRPAFHFSLEPVQLVLGLGHFEFSKDLLFSYQNAVADDKTGNELVKLLAPMSKKGFRIEGPEYKRVPKGFASDHPRGDLLRRKGLSVWNESPIPKEISENKTISLCMKQYQTMLPVYQWLATL